MRTHDSNNLSSLVLSQCSPHDTLGSPHSLFSRVSVIPDQAEANVSIQTWPVHGLRCSEPSRGIIGRSACLLSPLFSARQPVWFIIVDWDVNWREIRVRGLSAIIQGLNMASAPRIWVLNLKSDVWTKWKFCKWSWIKYSRAWLFCCG